MGSHNQFRIFGNTKGDAVLERQIEHALFNAKDGNCLDVWGRWSVSSKWYAGDLAVELSKKFPAVMFRFEQQGESGFSREFFMNGVSVDEYFVCQLWPSTSGFKSGVKKQAAYQKNRAAVTAKVNAEKAEQEKAARILKLKSELRTLEKTG